MNYRHAYHAGNFADVVKHAVLARLVEYLKRKDKPFRVIDTHAGIRLRTNWGLFQDRVNCSEDHEVPPRDQAELHHHLHRAGDAVRGLGGAVSRYSSDLS